MPGEVLAFREYRLVYTNVAIPDYDALVENFKVQFEAFNAPKLDTPITDKEWERIFNLMLGKSVFQNAKILRDKFVQRRKVKDFFIKFINSKVGNPLQIPDLRFLSKGSSHLPHFVFQHTLDFIAHGFRAGGAEMDANLVSGLSNLPHQCRGVLLWLNGRCVGRIFNSHILQGSFLQGIRSALPPFSLPLRFPLGSSFRQRE